MDVFRGNWAARPHGVVRNVASTVLERVIIYLAGQAMHLLGLLVWQSRRICLRFEIRAEERWSRNTGGWMEVTLGEVLFYVAIRGTSNILIYRYYHCSR